MFGDEVRVKALNRFLELYREKYSKAPPGWASGVAMAIINNEIKVVVNYPLTWPLLVIVPLVRQSFIEVVKAEIEALDTAERGE